MLSGGIQDNDLKVQLTCILFHHHYFNFHFSACKLKVRWKNGIVFVVMVISEILFETLEYIFLVGF